MKEITHIEVNRPVMTAYTLSYIGATQDEVDEAWAGKKLQQTRRAYARGNRRTFHRNMQKLDDMSLVVAWCMAHQVSPTLVCLERLSTVWSMADSNLVVAAVLRFRKSRGIT